MPKHFKDADHWFALCVKHRDDWTCQLCGERFPEGSRFVECMHLDARGKHQSRYKGKNALAGCLKHHAWAEQHKRDFGVWLAIVHNWQPEPWDLVEAKAVLRNLPEIARHYKAQYQLMLDGAGTFDDWEHLPFS